MSTQSKFELFERELINPLAGHPLSERETFVAATLLEAKSEKPIRIQDLITSIGHRFGEWPTEREVKAIVRSLRKVHAFPILSRRRKPAGLFWCSSAAEMNEFIASFRKQALDELHTLGKLVRQNYPELVGQLHLEDATTNL